MGNDGNGNGDEKIGITALVQSIQHRARCDDEEPSLQASCSVATFVALLRGGSAFCDQN